MKMNFSRKLITYLLLFLAGLIIYMCYFPQVLLHPNSVMSNNQEDALKNYYTFVYHTTHDATMLNFEGMNFPFGEHVVYTDSQPVISFVLRFMPFTHPYLVGILHWMIFLSLICTPLILFSFLRRLNLPVIASFFSALALGVLAPQFYKLNLGHYALAYTIIIPLEILLIYDLLILGKRKTGWWLCVYNCVLFFLHPYIGFSTALFCFLTLLIFFTLKFRRQKNYQALLYAGISGVVPVLFFQVFMALTDHHRGRPTLPFGLDNWNSSAGGILVPGYGPMSKIMSGIFHVHPENFEAYAYLGAFLILSGFAMMISLPFIWKRIKVNAVITALFIASLLLLMLSFGYHNTLMDLVGVRISALDQFRATGRFAWFFYYMLPILLITICISILHIRPHYEKIMNTAAVIFFACNMFEAHFYFNFDIDEHWKFRNVFNESQLTKEERDQVRSIRESRYKGIVPLRLFHGGSEMYERPGIYYAMPPALLYSYHCKLPVISTFLSRTSITETEELINIFNPYLKRSVAKDLLPEGDYLVVTAAEPLLADEERVLEKSHFLANVDSTQLLKISKREILDPGMRSFSFFKPGENFEAGTVYIPWENRKPFLRSNINDLERFYILDSNLVAPGDYIVSLHFHYDEKVYKAVSGNLIISRARESEYSWEFNPSLRVLNGFYEGFGVLEFKLPVESGCRYEFMIKGYHDQYYHISDFLLRPAQLDVIAADKNNDTLLNNFPTKYN